MKYKHEQSTHEIQTQRIYAWNTNTIYAWNPNTNNHSRKYKHKQSEQEKQAQTISAWNTNDKNEIQTQPISTVWKAHACVLQWRNITLTSPKWTVINTWQHHDHTKADMAVVCLNYHRTELSAPVWNLHCYQRQAVCGNKGLILVWMQTRGRMAWKLHVRLCPLIPLSLALARLCSFWNPSTHLP